MTGNYKQYRHELLNSGTLTILNYKLVYVILLLERSLLKLISTDKIFMVNLT